MKYFFARGNGRTRIRLQAHSMGTDLVVRIYNRNAHIGAMAIGEYDSEQERASVSVITRLGHKEDIIAQKAAYEISKATRNSACIIAGIHLTDITKEEIDQIIINTSQLVEELLKVLRN